MLISYINTIRTIAQTTALFFFNKGYVQMYPIYIVYVIKILLYCIQKTFH